MECGPQLYKEPEPLPISFLTPQPPQLLVLLSSIPLLSSFILSLQPVAEVFNLNDLLFDVNTPTLSNTRSISLELYSVSSSLAPISLLVPFPSNNTFKVNMVYMKSIAFLGLVAASAGAVPVLERRIAQQIPASTAKWEQACVRLFHSHGNSRKTDRCLCLFLCSSCVALFIGRCQRWSSMQSAFDQGFLNSFGRSWSLRATRCC